MSVRVAGTETIRMGDEAEVDIARESTAARGRSGGAAVTLCLDWRRLPWDGQRQRWGEDQD
jgi:hypothetical protein